MAENKKKTSILLKVVPVNADNLFKLENTSFVIPFNNKNYKVEESYRNGYNYENVTEMDSVQIVIELEQGAHVMKFLDEKGEVIPGVKMLRGESNE